jgi:spore coat protein CotH
MKRLGLLRGTAAATIALLLGTTCARAGQVHLRVEGTNLLIQVHGDADDDWFFQTSADCLTWSNAPALGPLLSGGNNAPWRAVGGHLSPRYFYRALKTAGLFDATLLRTISLTFTQANWQTMLANGRTYGTNTPCRLAMNNGATNYGVGARYKGNSSYTGLGGSGAPSKKSINLELDYVDATADLMSYKTVNLNNAYGDETILREPLYFNVMRKYTVCPQGSLAQLNINGANWGVYAFAQQENTDLIKEWFPSDHGDRWKAPNMGGGGGGGGPGGGGFSSGTSALSYLGANWTSYTNNYELKTHHSTNPWIYLIHATDVLNRTPTNQLRDKVEDVLAVDRWLWFLAIENIVTDEDSYYYKGADYEFYYEPESGRIHPVEHDGNESFTQADYTLSPIQGSTDTNRPVLCRLLGNAELRQRYLAHMRTVLEESFNPTCLTPLMNQLSTLTVAAIAADPKKGYTMTAYTNDLVVLKSFITNRYNYLMNRAELKPVPPVILAVYDPVAPPAASETPLVTARVQANGTNGLSSVWLYYRSKSYGRFTAVQMFDDGAHGDGAARDGVFGAATTNYPAGTKVRYYVEARSANSAQAASFAPARAEQDTCSYRVALTTATNTPVVINELMAANQSTLADPQGEYDDWIELHNITDQEVDLTGHYLSDEPHNPRKWQFPPGTKIAADGCLLVWADEDGKATAGLHASFKLEKSGEQILLTDTDAHDNAVLDSVTYPAQETDLSYGRSSDDADVWVVMDPTPGQPNR